jgi:hypothetical protein
MQIRDLAARKIVPVSDVIMHLKKEKQNNTKFRYVRLKKPCEMRDTTGILTNQTPNLSKVNSPRSRNTNLDSVFDRSDYDHLMTKTFSPTARESRSVTRSKRRKSNTLVPVTGKVGNHSYEYVENNLFRA